MNAVKVREYKLSRRGQRGVSVLLPIEWVRDNQLKPGDMVEIYRDSSDSLMIRKKSDSEGVK